MNETLTSQQVMAHARIKSRPTLNHYAARLGLKGRAVLNGRNSTVLMWTREAADKIKSAADLRKKIRAEAGRRTPTNTE